MNGIELRWVLRTTPWPGNPMLSEQRPVLQYRTSGLRNDPAYGLSHGWSEWKDVPIVEEA